MLKTLTKTFQSYSFQHYEFKQNYQRAFLLIITSAVAYFLNIG